MDCLQKFTKKRTPNPGNVMEKNGVLAGLETQEEYQLRWRSIYIMYFTVFLMALGFSSILTGVWPYLHSLDSTAGKEFMGFVVAANPLGQMIFSPLVGWWSNKVKMVNIPLLMCAATFTVSSFWYSVLELHTSYRKYWMLLTRVLIGISGSDIAVCRSYISAATTLGERTKAMSWVAFAQVLGFIVGPGIQAAVTPLGDEGYTFFNGYIQLNMYTALGWICVLLGSINFVLFTPAVFKEKKIAVKEAMLLQNVNTEKATWKGMKPDFLCVWTLIIACFTSTFNFVLLETLGTSLVMDQFGWSSKEALYYMGLLMSVGGVVACCSFASIYSLCKMFSEIKVLIWGGFFIMVLGQLLDIPWGSQTPPMAVPVSLNASNVTAEMLNNTDILGCPLSQEWCLYTPALTIYQFVIGYLFTSFSYPIGIALVNTIYSKVLGPRPQGTWMGWLTGAGCLSRAAGPVFISFIYTKYGTIWTFSLTSTLMIALVIWCLIMSSRIKAAVNAHLKYKGTNAEPETVAIGLLDVEMKTVS